MGSWDETCFLSQLPILEGSQAGVIFLSENHMYGSNNVSSGFVNSSDLYTPLNPPFWGHYNGYGEMLINSNQNNENIKRNFKDYVNETNVEKKEYSYLRIIFDDICYGNLKFKKIVPGSKDRCSGLVFVRPDVWNSILQISESNLTSLSDLANDYIQTYQETIKDLKNKENVDWYTIYSKIYDLNSRHRFRYFVEDTSHPLIRLFDKVIMEKTENLDTNIENEIQYFYELICVDHTMNELRKSWMPQPGKGSYCESFDIFSSYYQAMKRIADKEIFRYNFKSY